FHLKSHMHPDLTAEYHLTTSHHEKQFHAWLNLIHLLDEKHVHDAAKLDAALCKKLFQPSHSANATAPNSKASDGHVHTCPPALTIKECQLLHDNSGCFKCCCLFQNHTMHSCPNDFPDAKNYKVLTATDVEAAKKKHAKPVATVIEEEPAAKHAHITEVDDDTDAITVVMPLATLGEGTDSGEEYIAPLSVPHLQWSCLLEGPNLTFPLPVKALIDSASHLVLIDKGLILKLGLQCHQLHKSLNVSVALSSGDWEVMSLQSYIVLSCLSSDACFHSHSVCTIIAPHLCTPLLLGLPFLSHNGLVIDYALHTCVDKDTGYNLINPPLVSVPAPSQPVTPTVQTVKQLKNAVLEELHSVLPTYHKLVEDEFSDHFPVDIPPMDTLPDNVLVHVQPRDANKVIQLQSYDCPKKYHEAWK
ncbi:hypothetical protein M404DRAFT_101369, partial [Pisolithus tinctorius Marx 270]